MVFSILDMGIVEIIIIGMKGIIMREDIMTGNIMTKIMDIILQKDITKAIFTTDWEREVRWDIQDILKMIIILSRIMLADDLECCSEGDRFILTGNEEKVWEEVKK